MASSPSSSPSTVQAPAAPAPEDRLVALPDSILSHVLSFLPTLHAVRTSVVSKRWRTLWTSVDALDFDEKDNFFFFFSTGRGIPGTKRKRKRRGESSFAEFVDKVLSVHHTSALHKLRLSCYSENCQLKDWVGTAMSRGIRTLDLRLLPHPDHADGKPSLLPSLPFSGQSLVELRLDLVGSEFILPGTVALVGLRRMRLFRVKFCDDHSTRALFSSSTALRSLSLKNCDYQKLRCLEISSSSLQELTIMESSSSHELTIAGSLQRNRDDGLGSCRVKIAAPQLSYFVYRASVALGYVVEPPLSCVESVKIQFQHVEAREGSSTSDKLSVLLRASSLLSSLSSASYNVDICPICVEALRFGHFGNLDVIRMAVQHLDYHAIDVVERLLLLNRRLRAIVLEVRDLSVPHSSAGKPGIEECFLALKDLWPRFKGGWGVVEKVEIRFSGYGYPSSRADMSYTTDTVLELVKALLGSQLRLKKLVLSARLFCKGYSPTSSRRRDEVMGKIMSFPRRSRELAVAFI